MLGSGYVLGMAPPSGGGQVQPPDFELPLNDLGSGAVETGPSRGVGPATFTRATAASSKLSTGLWKLDVASGTARSSYLGMNTAVGAYGGYLSEGARTNLCLQSRDLSNASWTKVNTTAAKDQTGIDGVANSASSLTATLGGGTCLQTITEAATDSTLSMFIKRITGTGSITIQQGATTSEISAQVNSSTYTQVSLDATVLNPSIGISLGTNGDQIAVDCVQFENGAFASTPIPTTVAAVTRNADGLTYLAPGNLDDAVGSCYAEFTKLSLNAAGNSSVIGRTVTRGSPLSVAVSSVTTVGTHDNTTFFSSNVGASSITGVRKAVSTWGGSSRSISYDGTAVVTGAFDGSMGAGNIDIGGAGGEPQAHWGTIKNLRLWTRTLPDGSLPSMTL